MRLPSHLAPSATARANVVRPGHFTLLPLLLLAWAQLAASTCFVPNGTDRGDAYGGVDSSGKAYDYEPCRTSGHSMCCNKSNGDTCQDDGLCWNDGGRILWRESCTDPTWESPHCLKLCVGNTPSEQPPRFCFAAEWRRSPKRPILTRRGVVTVSAGSNVDMSGTDMMVTQCTDGSYCCGNTDAAKECCAAGEGVWVENGRVVTTTTQMPTSTSATKAKTSSHKARPSSTDHPGEGTSHDDKTNKNNGSSHAAVIGGAVGGSVGAVLIVSAVMVGFMNKQRRQAELRVSSAAESTVVEKSTPASDFSGFPSPPPPSELPSERTVSELPST